MSLRDVIPAQAGIHPEVYPRPGELSYLKMDSGLRRDDTVIGSQGTLLVEGPLPRRER